MIRPGIRLVWLSVLPLTCAVAALFVPALAILAWGSLVLAAVVAAVDWRAMAGPNDITGRREALTTFPVGVRNHINLIIHNLGKRPIVLTLHDHYPGEHLVQDMPAGPLSVQPGTVLELRYGFTPVRRGAFSFARIQARLRSPLELWDRTVHLGEPLDIRVYPDYAQVLQSGMLAACQRLDLIGIHRRRRRGEGTEFHQLRHFRPGDRLNQINWKSTAKHRDLISNEFQEERDQRVLILLDCSHRMRSRDGQLSHFDQALNAAILLAWFAARQGDAVGLMTFGTDQLRFVQPAKTPAVVNRMLDRMFDLHPSDLSPDYRETFSRVLTTIRKRSLIVILTTLRDDAREEMAAAIRPLLGHHIVLLANIREAVIDQISDSPITTYDDALAFLGAQEYATGVTASLAAIRTAGCTVLNSTAHDLPIAVTNHYLALKQSGRI